jgi:hypothetical protein
MSRRLLQFRRTYGRKMQRTDDNGARAMILMDHICARSEPKHHKEFRVAYDPVHKQLLLLRDRKVSTLPIKEEKARRLAGRI